MPEAINTNRILRFAEVTKEPASNAEVLEKIGMTQRALHDFLHRARSMGFEIWTICTGRGKETLYQFKSDTSHLSHKQNAREEILAILQANEGEYFARRELADMLNEDIDDVSRHIRALKKRGHFIDSQKIDFKTKQDAYFKQGL